MRSLQGSPGIHHCRATRVREETARWSSAQRLRKVDGSVKIVTLVSGPLLLDRFHAGKCDPTPRDRHQSKSALVLAEQAHWPFSPGSNYLDPGWKILLECYWTVTTACAICRRYVSQSNRNSRSVSPVLNVRPHSFNRRHPCCYDRMRPLDRRVVPDSLLHRFSIASLTTSTRKPHLTGFDSATVLIAWI